MRMMTTHLDEPRSPKGRAAPFGYAGAEKGRLSIVKFLIGLGANVHACNDYAIQFSAKKGHLPVVEYLVESGADVHANDDTALYWSVENGHFDIVKFLVGKGANACNSSVLECAKNKYSGIYDFLKKQMLNIYK